MNISSTSDLGTYLGFPLCHKKPSKNKLSFIIDKVEGKLASWKAKSLNKAGRLILINATLQAIPRYYMHMIDFPVAIKKKLDSICSNFFWISNGNKKRISWIAWHNICKPKSTGGLDLSLHSTTNKICLARLCWKLDNNVLWASKIIKEKYFNKNLEPLSFKKGSHIWRNIEVGWDHYERSLAWIVGDGANVNLWNKKWVNGDSLRALLIQGPLTKGESERRVNSLKDNDISCISSIPLTHDIIERVRSIRISNKSDFTYSSWTHLGKFCAKKARELIYPVVADESWDWIWKAPGLPKHKMFLWQIRWNRMPTNGNINYRMISHPSSCPFCPDKEENMDHILRSCHRASEIWGNIGFPVDKSLSFQDWMKNNCSLDLNSKLNQNDTKLPSNVDFVFAIWGIWLRRNAWVINKKNLPYLSSIKNSHWAATEWFYSMNQPKVGKAPSTTTTSSPSSLVPPSIVPDPLSLYSFTRTGSPGVVHSISSRSRGHACWFPPPPNVLKVNVDSSFLINNKQASLAAICTDHKGRWVGGVAMRTCCTDPQEAETRAILMGLEWVKENGWRSVIISSDCKNATKDISSRGGSIK